MSENSRFLWEKFWSWTKVVFFFDLRPWARNKYILHLDCLPVKSVVIRIKRDYLGHVGGGSVVYTSGFAGCTVCVVVLPREHNCVLVKLISKNNSQAGFVVSQPVI